MLSFPAFQSDEIFCAVASISSQIGSHLNQGDQLESGRIRASVNSHDISVNSLKAKPPETCQKKLWMACRIGRGSAADSKTPSNGIGLMICRSRKPAARTPLISCQIAPVSGLA